MFKYFRGALWVTVIGLTLAGVIGGTAGLWAAFNLALLETSLSFDNAVVNASILRHWDPLWRKRFFDLGHADRRVRYAGVVSAGYRGGDCPCTAAAGSVFVVGLVSKRAMARA